MQTGRCVGFLHAGGACCKVSPRTNAGTRPETAEWRSFYCPGQETGCSHLDQNLVERGLSRGSGTLWPRGSQPRSPHWKHAGGVNSSFAFFSPPVS